MKFHIILLIASYVAAASSDASLKAIENSNNDFAIKMFQLQTEKSKGNVVMSPFSIHSLLALLYQGSAGSTEQQIKQVLKLGTKQETADGYKKLFTSVINKNDVTLYTANRIFLNKVGLKLNKNFQTIAKDNFAAGTEEIDFSNVNDAAKTINKWVEDNTNKKIHSLYQPNDLSGASMVLANAVYFKGAWAYGFNKTNTRKEPFHLLDGKSAQCNMMHSQTDYLYGENKELDAKILDMPYKGGLARMIIVLPNAKTGLKELGNKLTNVKLVDVINRLASREVKVSLPRFKIESTIGLTRILNKMGLNELFNDKANFRGLADNKLRVTSATQKASIEINEEGAEASAASSLGFVPLSAHFDKQPSVVFEANHPFAYFLVNQEVNRGGEILYTILFSGQVAVV